MSSAVVKAIALRTDRLALTVDPTYGARILTLADQASGRQWLLEGPRAIDASEEADYLGDASRGWDECFPTVLSCHHAAWGGRLRDHGMLWGRPWEVVAAGSQRLEARFRGDGIDFSRTLTLEGAGMTAAYTVSSEREEAVPYLWSQHCVLRPEPGDRIVLSGQGRMKAAGVEFDWPRHPARDLSGVGHPDEGLAIKAYAPTPGPASAEVRSPRGGLRLDWDGTEVPALGIWLDCGGWPPGGPPLHQLALEPTTGEADDLAGAEAIGRARWLEAGDTHTWSIRLTLIDSEMR
jgi:galactose mutarotase-like enzyme